MDTHYPGDGDMLRAEIAAAAARMIAQDGADYGNAKRKAARQILGDAKVRSDFLPDNTQIENEVRLYNELFFDDTQPLRLLHLRKLASRLMDDLAQFQPYLTGAVLNGTAGEHSDIHLQLFTDSAKDVEIFLLNKKINFEVSETRHFKGNHPPVETLSFLWHKEGVHLTVYQPDDLRGAIKTKNGARLERANRIAVHALMTESTKNEG